VPTATPAQTAVLGPILAEQALADAIMPDKAATSAATAPQATPPQNTGGAGLLAQILEPRPAAPQTAPLGPMLAERALTQAVLPGQVLPGQVLPGQLAPGMPAPSAEARAQLAAAGLPHQQALGPGTAADAAKAAAAASAANASEARAASAGLSEALAAYSAPETSAAQIRAERAPVHFAVEIPVFFPGNPTPLRIEVEHDRPEPGEEGDEAPRPPSWTIRFAAEAGALGMVHAAITQVDERIGVQLWAERGTTAALFQSSAGELQNALAASDLRIEALSIAEGRPAEKKPAERHV
jgi:hypothetical protein